MIEQEVKIKYQDAHKFLNEHPMVLSSYFIIDTYYDIKDDNMLKNDIVLRIRQMDNKFFLAYKSTRKINLLEIVEREELEILVENKQVHDIIAGLGYYRRDVLEKRRIILKDNRFPDLNISRDIYPFTGEFLEIEGEEFQILSFLEYYEIPKEVLITDNCTEIFINYCIEHNIQFENIRSAQTFEKESKYYGNRYK